MSGAAGGADGAGLGLYIHAPFCKHACPYCDFYKFELRDRPARERLDFAPRVAAEHALLLDAEPGLAQRPIETIHFGGGTPSTLPPGGVIWLLGELRSRHARGTEPPEVAIEANPENLTPARCEAWRRAGATRLSIGVQSFDAADLARLERLHGPELVPQVVGNARRAGFDNLSLDLMFALPGQSIDGWLSNLRKAVALEPEHLSFYGLTIHEGTPFAEEMDAGRLDLPGEEEQAEMYLRGAELLAAEGYEHYEISNFARPGCRSRHNLRYWHGLDVLGLGPGAHSSLGGARWANPDDIDAWKSDIAAGSPPRREVEQLGEDAEREEQLFRRMRTTEGIDFAGSIGPIASAWLRSAAGEQALREGLVEQSAGRMRLTVRGWLVSDSILQSMLARWSARIP